eukprot:240985-Chlamydomonas_euryale.AAC.1
MHTPVELLPTPQVADDGSEHQHRLALIINKSIQAHVTRAMSEAFQRNGIERGGEGVLGGRGGAHV